MVKTIKKQIKILCLSSIKKFSSKFFLSNTVDDKNYECTLNLNLLFIIFIWDLDKKLMDFFGIWPISQWVSSLLSLVVMYWFVGRWYNKKLEKKGGWLSTRARIGMIVVDLALNLVVGLYYMSARDTLLGMLVMRCPIAISPLIFLLEFMLFSYYYKKYVLNSKENAEQKAKILANYKKKKLESKNSSSRI